MKRKGCVDRYAHVCVAGGRRTSIVAGRNLLLRVDKILRGSRNRVYGLPIWEDVLEEALWTLDYYHDCGEFEPDFAYGSCKGQATRICPLTLRPEIQDLLRRIQADTGASMGALIREALDAYVTGVESGALPPPDTCAEPAA